MHNLNLASTIIDDDDADEQVETADIPELERVRVLVVDDDRLCRSLCSRYLAQSARYEFEILSVENGSDAVRRIREEHFDCLLLDYYLPDQTGTEVLRQINALGDYAPPAIILTANGGEEAAISAVRAGATDFLPKRALSRKSLSRAIDNAIYNSRLKQSIAAKRQELQATNDKLRARNAEIQRFYNSVSHEVKTPLTAVREFVALTRDGIFGPVTDEQKEMLDHALDGCDQIAGHFNGLVEMTRLEHGKISLTYGEADFNAIVAQCAAGVRSAARAKKLGFEAFAANDLPEMLVDRNRIIQVISNLLGNAVKFTPEGGSVRLSIARADTGDGVEISVADTGCGIAADDLERIFERLYQVEGKGDDLMGAGLGLGLSITREIVTLHGGTIYATSELGKGSTFNVRLPIHLSPATETPE